MSVQLTLDDREIPYRLSRRVPRLGNTQKAVLRRLALEPLDSSQLEREIPGGADAVRRLRDRAMVEKHAGLWFVAEGWK